MDRSDSDEGWMGRSDSDEGWAGRSDADEGWAGWAAAGEWAGFGADGCGSVRAGAVAEDVRRARPGEDVVGVGGSGVDEAEG
ncbi:hypothetical protein GCM10009828_054930 [Actinoplanes couchii]|uniref:Uncharacterized protein n=1 Tax=Actinoplanes couchii TaxID=403638 RepID=A0ABQ3X0V5_9ACTN|nr:hypothetical protein Aco03nite_005100 [Actinoplanes couchii]